MVVHCVYLCGSIRKSETITDFKKNIQEAIAGDNKVRRFRLYCEKVLTDFYHTVDVNPIMNMNIGERKYIVENIVPIFKFYERTYTHIYFDWLVFTSKLHDFCRTGPDVDVLSLIA
ncbi:hypothetical protein BC937DRAFT_90768 [Endogone sp. FLAS-F59071]|nr:hypothetical protein BC937DRAFT_90768 [Endogone sp. FLAS-F59071]|eukprot:RUS16813.1 hypothetical protein BC937DRAFT_90768 [Endogone sp. FLAS-F59071]